MTPRRAACLALLALPLLLGADERRPPAGPGTGSCSSAGCHADLGARAVVHAAFEPDGCGSCHEAKKGDGHGFRLTAPSVAALCVTCHDDPRKTGKLVHGPVKDDCTKCHDPHSAPHPKLLVRVGNDLCLGCHDNLPKEMERPFTHGAVYDPGCEKCHVPHASNSARLLRVPGNALCLECHGAAATAGPRVVLKDGRGHPVHDHPVEGYPDPRQPSVPLWCASCHEPHGAVRKHLLRGPAGGWIICRQCHTK